MTTRILIMPGDGVGPEICREAVRMLETLAATHALDIELGEALIGRAAIDIAGDPLPESSLAAATKADAIIVGAIGRANRDESDVGPRPEAGLWRLRRELGLFANLRPVVSYSQLVHASALKPGIVSGLDIMVVRELTGGADTGQPAGTGVDRAGRREAWNTMRSNEAEIARIGRVGFDRAAARGGRLCSVDAGYRLDVSRLWRDVIDELGADYPAVELSQLSLDDAVKQLVQAPRRFDTVVAGNRCGDVLADIAATLIGAVGMLPSAAIDARGKGLYQPIHGSAPGIANQDLANPVAIILSVAMMLRYTLGRGDLADKIEAAVRYALDRGLRTRDIMDNETQIAGTQEMAGAIVDMLV